MNIDLSRFERVSLFSVVATSTPQSDRTYRVTVQQEAAGLMVYPVPHPLFPAEFLVVVQSNAGPLAATPTVEVEFNNLETTLHPDPVNEQRLCFVASYGLPSSGAGKVTARSAGTVAGFAFTGTLAKDALAATLAMGNMSLRVAARTGPILVAEDPSPLACPGLITLSKPVLVQGNPARAAATSLHIRLPFLDSSLREKVGLAGISGAARVWHPAAGVDETWSASLAGPGRYVWASDVLPPTIAALPAVTREGRLRLPVQTTDDGSGIAADSVGLNIGPWSLRPVPGDTAGTWLFDLTALPPGQREGLLLCADQAGNRASLAVPLNLPGPLRISQALAFPNPARGPARVRVTLAGAGADDLAREGDIVWYDTAGRRVAEQALLLQGSTSLEARWDTRTSGSARSVANGIYLGRIKVRVGDTLLKANCRLAILR